MPYGGKTSITELIDEEKNAQKTIKIQITSAVFIHRQWTNKMNYVTVDVIPFHQIKSCSAVLKESTKESIELGTAEVKYLGE